MGSFSWLKADNLTAIGNIVCGKPFKFLIPKAFGGGFIKDRYQDYGLLGSKPDGSPKYDMYELLAFWNVDEQQAKNLMWDGKEDGTPAPMMKEIDQYTDHNRAMGIGIGCYDNDIINLKYPLKLVSASFKGNYESCIFRSFWDPNQGFGPLKRTSWDFQYAMKRANALGFVKSRKVHFNDLPVVQMTLSELPPAWQPSAVANPNIRFIKFGHIVDGYPMLGTDISDEQKCAGKICRALASLPTSSCVTVLNGTNTYDVDLRVFKKCHIIEIVSSNT